MKAFLLNSMKTTMGIHLFAVVHVGTVLITSWVGVPDAFLLTILTVLMISMLAIQNDYPLDATLLLGVFACIAAFYLGTWGAALLSDITTLKGIPLRCLSTFLITELLGWIIHYITRSHKRREQQQ